MSSGLEASSTLSLVYFIDEVLLFFGLITVGLMKVNVSQK